MQSDSWRAARGPTRSQEPHADAAEAGAGAADAGEAAQGCGGCAGSRERRLAYSRAYRRAVGEHLATRGGRGGCTAKLKEKARRAAREAARAAVRSGE